MRFPLPIPFAVAALLLAGARPLRAEEPPAPKAPVPLEKDLAAAKALLKDGRWKAARDAFLKLFADRTRDPEVIRRLADIEEDLKLASFRAQEPEPTAEALFGKGAVKYYPSSRKVEFNFAKGPAAPTWQAGGEGLRLLPVKFDEVVLEWDGGRDDDAIVLIAYDPDRKSGCGVVPGYSRDGRTRPTSIVLIDGDKTQILDTNSSRWGRCRISHRPGKVTVTDGISEISGGGPPLVTSGSSPRIQAGILAIKSIGWGPITVNGVVEKSHAQAAIASHYERRFRAWVAASWVRTEVLPAWATSAPAITGPAILPAPLPADAPDPVPAAILRALAHWSRGELKEFVQALPPPDDLRAATRHYLQGLHALGEGRLADAEDLLSGVVEREPEFVPALVYRGFGRLRRRDLPGARTDLEKAVQSGGAVADAWIGLAHLAIVGGDLAAAERHLADARSRGMTSPLLDLLETRVLRSRRGPPWTKRFEVKGAAAVVATDHSLDMAQQVSRVVEGTLSLGTAVFPGTVRASAPIRVYVFSSREGFVAYCASLGRPAANVVGMYVPVVRELVFYVTPVSREEFWNTARHEAFHAFLHASLEEAPLWFNEGWAECFGYGKPIAGGIELAHPGIREKQDAGLGAVNATLIEALFLKDPEAFMKDAASNYVISRMLVTFLYDGLDRKYRRVLMEYFTSLRAGLSAKAAFEKHWKPIVEDVARGLRNW